MILRRAAPVADSELRRTRYEAVFGAVYEPLQRYLLRRAAADDAQDALAETLTVLWRRLDDVPEEAEVQWCFGVARRCLANQRRSNERARRLATRAAAEAQVQSTEPPEPDPLLEEAMAQLNPDDREVLRLWAWEGLQPREIAVVLGVTANAASIRLHRAKQWLRTELVGKNGGDGGQVVGGDTCDERAKEAR